MDFLTEHVVDAHVYGLLVFSEVEANGKDIRCDAYVYNATLFLVRVSTILGALGFASTCRCLRSASYRCKAGFDGAGIRRAIFNYGSGAAILAARGLRRQHLFALIGQSSSSGREQYCHNNQTRQSEFDYWRRGCMGRIRIHD